MLDALAVLLRALSFIAVFEAAGGALFLALLRVPPPAAQLAILSRLRIVTIAALLLVLAHFGLEAPRMAGELAGFWDLQMQHLAWQTAPGRAMRFKETGLLLVFAGLYLSGAARSVLCALGAAVVVAAFTSMGHTVDHPHHLWLTLLLLAHLAAVTFWFGAIVPLRQAVTCEAPDVAADLLERFSRLAVWIVPGLLLAAVSLVVLLVPGLSVFAQPYGRLLLAKVAGFCVLMVLAGRNKLRLTPSLRRHDPAAVVQLRRSLTLEYVVIAAVLAVTALMTGLYSPD